MSGQLRVSKTAWCLDRIAKQNFANDVAFVCAEKICDAKTK